MTRLRLTSLTIFGPFVAVIAACGGNAITLGTLDGGAETGTGGSGSAGGGSGSASTTGQSSGSTSGASSGAGGSSGAATSGFASGASSGCVDNVLCTVDKHWDSALCMCVPNTGTGSGTSTGSASGAASGASSGTHSGSTSGASSGTTADAGARCTSDASCGPNEICGFPTAQGCSATGTCFPAPQVTCQAYLAGCACDGSTENLTCNGLPNGYAPKPLLHDGQCTADAGTVPDASNGQCLSGQGGPCLGLLAHPCLCKAGLVCVPSTVPDMSGTCEPSDAGTCVSRAGGPCGGVNGASSSCSCVQGLTCTLSAGGGTCH